MTNGVPAQPAWDRLLGIGIEYVRNNQPAWIFVAGNVALQVVSVLLGAGPVLGVVVSLAVSACVLFLTLLLARHALTGRFGTVAGDGMTVLKLCGVFLALGIGLAVVGNILIGLLGAVLGVPGVVVGALLVIGLALFVVARIAFYLPALSVGHPTTLMQAFAQTEPYWGRILAVMLAPAIVAVAVTLLLGRLLPGLFGAVLAALLGGTVGAIGGAATIAALAYLYAHHVRAGQT
jgi:hypothetical protein